MPTLLLAVDGTQRGFDTVSIMGRLFKDTGDINIVLFHCVQQTTTLLPGDICTEVEEGPKLPIDDEKKSGQAVLKASLTRLTDAGFPENKVELRLKVGSVDPAGDIINEADAGQIRTIVLGSRGRSHVEALLLGSVSAKVAQNALDKVVWIVDTPVNDSMKVLIAMEGVPEVRELSCYTADLFGACPGLNFSFMHIIPPVPPTFWDDGHILGPAEQKDRQAHIEKWRTDWTETVTGYMSEGRDLLLQRGVEKQRVETVILPTREGIARDLLNEIEVHKFQIVVMGKESFRERKPFLMGSRTAKILQNARGIILCMV